MTDLNDPIALADLAGELDDTDNDPAGDDAGADPPTSAPYYTGTVASGPEPYPGKLLGSRFGGGVLLIDRPHNRAWVLDYTPPAAPPAGPAAAGNLAGSFACRDTAGAPVDDERRMRAAEGSDYDVRAYDPAFDGDDPVDCTDPAGCDTGGDTA